MMAIELPPLPYPKDGLEPHISAETIEYHYGKHHQKYVTKLNQLITGTEYAEKSLEQIISSAGNGPIFNNAAQVWNHNFYWQSMSLDGGQAPGGALAQAIDTSFGSFENMRSEFTRAAVDLFGVGWVWLVNDGEGVVSIIATNDADNPLERGRIALLACDVWEHAFYIDYRNDKAKYMEAFWKVANCKFAERRFASA